jgi:flagellar biosynthetic protein FliO
MNGASDVLLFIRVGFSLSIVLGLIWLAARVAKRRGKIATRQSETTNIDVVARRQVGRRSSLVVVESAGRRLLVGVTDNQIALVADLSSTDAPELPAPIEVPAGRTVVAPPVELPVAPATSRPTPRPAAPIDALPVDITATEDPALPKRDSLVDTLRDMTVRR